MSTAEFSKRAAIFIGLALIPVLVWHLFNVVLIVVAAVLFGAAYLFGTGVGFEMQEVMRRIEEAQQTITQSMNNSQIGKTILSHLQGQNVPVGQLIGGALSYQRGLSRRRRGDGLRRRLPRRAAGALSHRFRQIIPASMT
jgi:hypothetical protein